MTLVSAIPSDQGWIRLVNSPRWLELLLIAIVAIACLASTSPHRWALVVALAAAAAIQVWRTYSYLPFVRPEIAVVATGQMPGYGSARCAELPGRRSAFNDQSPETCQTATGPQAVTDAERVRVDHVISSTIHPARINNPLIR